MPAATGTAKSAAGSSAAKPSAVPMLGLPIPASTVSESDSDDDLASWKFGAVGVVSPELPDRDYRASAGMQRAQSSAFPNLNTNGGAAIAMSAKDKQDKMPLPSGGKKHARAPATLSVSPTTAAAPSAKSPQSEGGNSETQESFKAPLSLSEKVCLWLLRSQKS